MRYAAIAKNLVKRATYLLAVFGATSALAQISPVHCLTAAEQESMKRDLVDRLAPFGGPDVSQQAIELREITMQLLAARQALHECRNSLMGQIGADSCASEQFRTSSLQDRFKMTSDLINLRIQIIQGIRLRYRSC